MERLVYVQGLAGMAGFALQRHELHAVDAAKRLEHALVAGCAEQAGQQ
jgi:hypothetical protein